MVASAGCNQRDAGGLVRKPESSAGPRGPVFAAPLGRISGARRPPRGARGGGGAARARSATDEGHAEPALQAVAVLRHHLRTVRTLHDDVIAVHLVSAGERLAESRHVDGAVVPEFELAGVVAGRPGAGHARAA